MCETNCEVRNQLFTFHQIFLDYVASQRFCKQLGGRLATFKSGVSSWNAIRNCCHGNNIYRIGLKRCENGKYQWEEEEECEYEDLIPSFASNRECLVANVRLANRTGFPLGGLSDCNQLKPFICEKSLPNTLLNTTTSLPDSSDLPDPNDLLDSNDFPLTFVIFGAILFFIILLLLIFVILKKKKKQKGEKKKEIKLSHFDFYDSANREERRTSRIFRRKSEDEKISNKFYPSTYFGSTKLKTFKNSEKANSEKNNDVIITDVSSLRSFDNV